MWKKYGIQSDIKPKDFYKLFCKIIAANFLNMRHATECMEEIVIIFSICSTIWTGHNMYILISEWKQMVEFFDTAAGFFLNLFAALPLFFE